MYKKALILFIGALMYLPASVRALETLSEVKMKNTRGQAGVEVEVDNVEFEEESWEYYYFDDDGITGTPDDGAGIRTDSYVGSKTVRAIYDGTDRDGYLKQAYGPLMSRETNALVEAHAAWQAENPDGNTADIDTWIDLFPDVVERISAVTGGDIEPSPIVIDVTRKLELTSWISAFNRRSEGLEMARQVYNELVGLELDYSGDTEQNVSRIVSETGMTEEEARKAYFSASRYVAVQADPDNQTLAARAGAEVILQEINIDGVVARLPTLEVRTSGSSRSVGIVSEGSVNDGKSFIRMMSSDSTLTILGGTVEVTAN